MRSYWRRGGLLNPYDWWPYKKLAIKTNKKKKNGTMASVAMWGMDLPGGHRTK